MSIELEDADEDCAAWMDDNDLRACVREAIKRGLSVGPAMYRPAIFDAEAILRDVVNIWNAWGYG